MPPLAYFITFSTHGSHLPGDPRGWVRRDHNIHGMPIEPANPLCITSLQQQGITPYTLNTESQRALVLDSLLKTCQIRTWQAIAIHVRTKHVHCLVKAACPPEQAMTSMKAHATRALKEYHVINGQPTPRKFWAEHGSTLYVWDVKELDPITHYIYYEQGNPMARFCLNPDLHDASRNTHGWEN